MLFLTISGGGTQVIGEILKNGVASSYFGGAYVPYNQKLFDDFLGFKPEKYNSQLAARQLSKVTFQKALDMGFNAKEIVSVGVTASLTTGPNERVDRKNSFYISEMTYDSQTTCSGDLKKELSRNDQEYVLLQYLQYFLGSQIPQIYISSLSIFDEIKDVKLSIDLVGGEKESYKVFFDTKDKYHKNLQEVCLEKPITNVVYSGSFNPLHDGHKAIIEYANQKFGEEVTIDISVTNVEKASLDYFDRNFRIEQFRNLKGAGPVCFGKFPLFLDKMHVYKLNTVFLMGVDTANRIIKHDSFAEVVRYKKIYNDRFVVFPRGDEKLLGFEDVFDLQKDFNPINLSSRSIRNAAGV